MTRGSVLEYREAIRGRYLKAGKKEKARILDEFTQVTGYHRKATIRLLRREPLVGHRERRGGQRRYGPEVVDALRKVWEATGTLWVACAPSASSPFWVNWSMGCGFMGN